MTSVGTRICPSASDLFPLARIASSCRFVASMSSGVSSMRSSIRSSASTSPRKAGPESASRISRISSLASSFVRAGPLGRMIFQIVPSLPRPVAGLPVADESDASERILSG